MRDVNDPENEAPPKTGGWLHLDTLAGVRAEMIIAALLDLGLPVRLVDDAFARADLVGLGVRTERSRRGARSGLAVQFVDGQGRALTQIVYPAGSRSRRSARSGRRRGPAPHPAARLEQQAVAATLAEDDGEDGGAEVLAGPSPPEETPARVPGAVALWLTGHPATGTALLRRLTSTQLRPLEKALAHKALRRALQSRAAVGGDSLDDLSVDGPAAVRALCAAVAFGALVDALSPAQVTATPILVNMGTDPAVLAALAGARVREEELDWVPTDVLGAACVWAVSHRFGPRGDLVPRLLGAGLGPVHRRGHCHALSASYGDAPTLGATGEPHSGATVELSATLPGELDRERLLAALAPAGARDVVLCAVDSDAGAVIQLLCSAPEAAREPVTRALWSAGARRVRASESLVRAPLEREVTVAVGRGNKKVPVRVVSFLDEGELLWREPRREDVIGAARQLGVPPGAVRDEALLAEERREEPDEQG